MRRGDKSRDKLSLNFRSSHSSLIFYDLIKKSSTHRHHVLFVPFAISWFEVYEYIVVIIPDKSFRSSMSQLSRLVKDHLTGLQQYFMNIVLMIKNEQRPGSTILSNVQNSTKKDGSKHTWLLTTSKLIHLMT